MSEAMIAGVFIVCLRERGKLREAPRVGASSHSADYFLRRPRAVKPARAKRGVTAGVGTVTKV